MKNKLPIIFILFYSTISIYSFEIPDREKIYTYRATSKETAITDEEITAELSTAANLLNEQILSEEEIQLTVIKALTLTELFFINNKEKINSMSKKEKKSNSELNFIKQAYNEINNYIKSSNNVSFYPTAAEYSFAMINLFGDAGKIYSMQASAYIKRILKDNINSTEGQVLNGIYLAQLIYNRNNHELNNIKTSALKFLSDPNIEQLTDKVLKYRALCHRSAISMKTLDSEQAYIDYKTAETIFPESPFSDCSGIYYRNEALANTQLQQLGFGFDMQHPYYNDIGLKFRKGDTELLAPFIGIGMRKTFFSSSFFAEAGVKVFHKNFKWNLQYLHSFIPSFSTFDYSLHEYYASTKFEVDFSHIAVSSETTFGNMLFAPEGINGTELKKDALRIPALKQNFNLDISLFDDGLNHLSALIDTGIYYVPSANQASGYIHAKMPGTFDFVHSELALLPELYYTGWFTNQRSINIGKRHLSYNCAIPITEDTAGDTYNNFYRLSGNIDFSYRIFLPKVKAPADRVYFGLHFNTGFATDLEQMQTNPIYAGGLSIGFDLYDSKPFEIRFTVDQDANAYFMMTMVHPAKHKF